MSDIREFVLNVTAAPATAIDAVISYLSAGQSATNEQLVAAGRTAIAELPYTEAAYDTGKYQDQWHFGGGRGWWLSQSHYNSVYVENYDAASNTWGTYAAPAPVTVRGGTSRYIGHVYSGSAFDPVEPAGYWFPSVISPSDPTWGTYPKWLMKRTNFISQSATLWTEPGTSNFGSTFDAIDATAGLIGSSGNNAIAWHPNLFGVGDGGVVVAANDGIGAWRKSTDSWSVLWNNGTTWVGNGQYTCAEYSPGLDAVIVGTLSTTQPIRLVSSGGVVTALPAVPSGLSGISPYLSAGSYGVLVGSPTDTVYILERNKADTAGTMSGVRRAWKLRADLSSWDRISDHPFYGSADGDYWWPTRVQTGSGWMVWAIQSQYPTKFRNTFWKPSA